MAFYNYKLVLYSLPDFIIQQQGPDYEGGCDYDGDGWCATADYITWLENNIPNLKELYEIERNKLKETNEI